MNNLSTQLAKEVNERLAEKLSIRDISKLTGVSKNTVWKLHKQHKQRELEQRGHTRIAVGRGADGKLTYKTITK
jgi:DNA-directed RNA polymerase specialized sigma24 family protein